MMVDTSFCIDLMRERRRGETGAATRKLMDLGRVRLEMSLFVYCELQHGARAAARREEELRRIERLAELIPVRSPDRALAVFYGEAAARLQSKGRAIPQMDLLIGAHAAALGTPLLTRDPTHFQRIEGLIVESYED